MAVQFRQGRAPSRATRLVSAGQWPGSASDRTAVYAAPPGLSPRRLSASRPAATRARHRRDHSQPGNRPRHDDGEADIDGRDPGETRSEEHTSELQSLMRSSYAVFCLKKKTTDNNLNKQPQRHTDTN